MGERRLDFFPRWIENHAVARIVIEHLSKTFVGPGGERICALKDVSLAIDAGELMVLVGPSGCGKTTALRLVAGLDNPSSGGIAIDGQPMNGVAPKARDVAMVFQNPALYPHLTVWENLAFGLKVRRYPAPEVAQRVREVAAMLGLEGCMERRPAELSGGQCQRVAVGRALVRRPKILLFDEPFSNLDPQLRSQMRLEISRLHRRLSTTILYVTHDQIEAMTLGQRVAVLCHGELHQAGPPDELCRRPATAFVAGFIGSPPMNLLGGTIESKDGKTFFQSLPGEGAPGSGGLRLQLHAGVNAGLTAQAGRRIIMGVRPQDILLGGAPGTKPNATAQAVVELVERTGADSWLHLSCAGHRFIARAGTGAEPSLGDEVAASFDLSHVQWFDHQGGRALLCAS